MSASYLHRVNDMSDVGFRFFRRSLCCDSKRQRIQAIMSNGKDQIGTNDGVVVANLAKSYRGAFALKDVSLRFPKGSVSGVIGPNGAGKSTLLELITGFRTPDSGMVSFDGKTLEAFESKKKIFAYMPERLELYPDFRVDEFIHFIQEMTRCVDSELVDALALPELGCKRIGELSKGQRQRLKLFSALSNDKNVVVLDEPFDGFDPLQMLDVIKLIKSENRKGRSFILSIHQLSDAEKICDHYALLDNGQVVAEGTKPELENAFECEGESLERIFIKALR